MRRAGGESIAMSAVKEICVVIPTLNEAGTIRDLVQDLVNLDRYNVRPIIVDDGSTDGTLEILRDLRQRFERLVIVERGRKLGLGSALREGFGRALELEPAPDFILTMDGDFSHDPDELSRLVDMGSRDSVTIGSRYVEGGKIEGWGLQRNFISKTANFLARVFANIPAKDCTSGYRCYGIGLEEVLSSLESDGYDIQIEALSEAARHGYGITEVPIVFTDRKSGDSKLDFPQLGMFLSRVFSIFRSRLPSF